VPAVENLRPLFCNVKRCIVRGMSTITFDTQELVRELRTSGLPQEQAEAVVRAIVKSHDDLATKRDIDDLRREIQSMEMRLTIKLGAFLTVAVGILFTLLRH